MFEGQLIFETRCPWLTVVWHLVDNRFGNIVRFTRHAGLFGQKLRHFLHQHGLFFFWLFGHGLRDQCFDMMLILCAEGAGDVVFILA